MGKINENSAKSTKTKNVTPAVTPWGKNRVKNTETGKHVLIMPGIGTRGRRMAQGGTRTCCRIG